MMRDQLGDVGLDLVAAAFAPHNEPRLGRERLPQRQRSRLAIAPVARHNPSMAADPGDDDGDDRRAAAAQGRRRQPILAMKFDAEKWRIIRILVAWVMWAVAVIIGSAILFPA